MSHNPYVGVGIQRTIFEQGWQRALNAVKKAVEDDAPLDTSVFSDAYVLDSILYIIEELRKRD